MHFGHSVTLAMTLSCMNQYLYRQELTTYHCRYRVGDVRSISPHDSVLMECKAKVISQILSRCYISLTWNTHCSPGVTF